MCSFALLYSSSLVFTYLNIVGSDSAIKVTNALRYYNLIVGH